MPFPYDASMKHLLSARLADWLPLSGRPVTGPVEVMDAELSTVTAAADKVVRVGGPPAHHRSGDVAVKPCARVFWKNVEDDKGIRQQRSAAAVVRVAGLVSAGNDRVNG